MLLLSPLLTMQPVGLVFWNSDFCVDDIPERNEVDLLLVEAGDGGQKESGDLQTTLGQVWFVQIQTLLDELMEIALLLVLTLQPSYSRLELSIRDTVAFFADVPEKE